jgi:soluble lytic murein transglycosylase
MAARAVFLILLLTSLLAAPAGADPAQRERFLEAEAALAAGDLQRFERLRDELADYPLRPYLDYEFLKRHIDSIDERAIVAFLDAYPELPLNRFLRARWLDRMADDGRWAEFLTLYEDDGNVARQCHYLHALIDTGRPDEALPRVVDIWLHGKSRPRACDPVFAAWEAAGMRTPALTWQRIEKAMLAGQSRLARYLARALPGGEREWVERWIQLYRDPDRVVDHARFAEPHPYREAMLAHAVRRAARSDGEVALGYWREIGPRYRFNRDQVKATEQYILRNLVRVPGDAAYDFIRQVEVDADDSEVHAARVRAALLREDWPRVIDWVSAMPDAQRELERWQYWLARALEGIGDRTAAETLYREVARDRSYYGFMAADRIGAEYHLHHADTPVAPALVALVGERPALQRARELFALERWTDGRREWHWATRDMETIELKAAAKLAQQQGWHDRAIFTLARTGYWDDLELRFPLEHAELVDLNAARQGIDTAWVFAVMRQESAFMQQARSHAGAMGLMQLMPATAKSVARDVLKQRPPRRADLFRPDTNIALGSAYLSQMKDRLGGSPILATAAYNAGPHRVTRWLPPRLLPADIWIELVPFRETRGYLRRVLAYMVIYEKRMGREPVRLRDRLHPVPPSIGMLGDNVAASEGRSAG